MPKVLNDLDGQPLGLHGVLSDKDIRAVMGARIVPFSEGVSTPGVISYGLSCGGYDLRAARNFKVFTNARGAVVDPKRFDPNAFVDVVGDVITIPGNGFALAQSMEWFDVPNGVIVVVLGKSTYARCGIVVNCTPLEPGWKGFVTLEISNTGPTPALVYANEGIAQALFLPLSSEPERSYAAKGGRYQDQTGLTLPRV